MDVIAHHEAGHAVLAYYHGGGIGRARFFPYHDAWGGSVLHAPNPRRLLSDIDYVGVSVERLFAGEIAARKYLGMDEASVAVEIPGADWWGPSTPIRRIASHLENLAAQSDHPGLDDITKIIGFTSRYKPGNWWSWLQARHSEARRVLADNEAAWRALGEDLAERIEQGKATDAKEIIVPGFQVLMRLRNHGMKLGSPGEWPIEVTRRRERERWIVSLYRPIASRFGRVWVS